MLSDQMDPVRKIYSVSELTKRIKTLIEENFPFIWISGEISNFRIPASGHYYFTLKDESSQISAVMFKGNQQHLKFVPENGMSVIGLGRIGLYEPRGAYQIILEYVEPSGIGALQAAFEQLKKRLQAEGLFDPAHKKPLPYLPRTIALITSSTGAVVHDMLNIISRRFPNVCIEIIAAKVQGNHAEKDIVNAIALLNEKATAEVAILARGGGSLEDLHAFNSEQVARAIFGSNVPIISAIGHETDFTISDFVADLRAPTPSAAAEIVLPEKAELIRRIKQLTGSLENRFTTIFRILSDRYASISKRLIHPLKKVQDYRLHTDDLVARSNRAFYQLVAQKSFLFKKQKDFLFHLNPINKVDDFKQIIDNNVYKIFKNIKILIDNKKSGYREISLRLEGLSPLAILARGYSIARSIPDEKIVTDAGAVISGQRLEISLYRGKLICRIEEIKS